MTLKLLARFLKFDGTVWTTVEASDESNTGLWSINIPSGSPNSDYYLDGWSAPAYKGGTTTVSPGQTGVYVGTPYSSAGAVVLAEYGRNVGLTNYYGVATFSPVGGQNVATIHYDTQDGSILEDTTIRHGTKYGNITVTIPANKVPTRADYEFLHWAYGTGTYSPGDQITIPYTGTTTITAVWRRTHYYTTIVYDSNGGTGAPNNQTDRHSQTSGTVTVYLNNDTFPTKAGWLFGGWTVKGTVYAPGAAITLAYNEETTAHAYWVQNAATVAYNPDNDTQMDPTVVKNAQTSGTVQVTIRTDIPVKKYWMFSHWRDSAGHTYAPGATIGVGYNSTVTLTAVYSRLTVTVTLNSERGQGPQEYHPEQGGTFTLPSQTEEGYVFKGWAETEGGQVRYRAGVVLQIETADIILYAVWNTEFNEEQITLADGSTLHLADVTWYLADQRTQEIGIGTSSVYLSDLGYSGVQFVPKAMVEKYPLAFGISPTDMNSPNNPDLDYANVVDPHGRMTVQFFEQAGGYARDAVRLAIIDLASMTGFILTCYLSQETDTTVYTIRLMKSETDPAPTIIDGLLGSYRNPYLFTFPMYEEGNQLLDKWRSADTGTEYNAGDTLSLSGRYITPEQTLTFIAIMATKTTVLKFAMQGGRNGPAAITTVATNEATFRIPESNPTRRGYTFRGWAASANSAPSFNAGDTITAPAGTVTVLYASWAVIRAPFTTNGKPINGPYCGIRIWMEQGGRRYYFNATFYQVDGGLAVINKAENRPGSATFTLANDYEDKPRSLCADTFAQWADSESGEINPEVRRAIEPGMYVEFLNITGIADYTPIADGRITTMTPNGETVTFEVGDGLAFLAKTGTWLRRNYRSKNGVAEAYLNSTRPDDGKLHITIPKDKGTPSAAYRLKTNEVEVPLSKIIPPGTSPIIAATSQRYGADVSRTVEGKPCTYLRRVSFNVKWDIVAEYTTPYIQPRVEIYLPGQEKPKGHPIAGMDIGSLDSNKDYTVDLDIPLDGDLRIEINAGVSNFNYGDVTVRNCTVWLDDETLVEVPTTEYTDTADSYEQTSYYSRLRVVFEGGKVDVPEIMEQIAEAIGYGHDTATSAPRKELAIFRAGGSYAQTYMQKLADQEDDKTGRRLSYTVDGASPVLRIGTRYKTTDAPVYAIKYGGDKAPAGFEGTVINLADFTPKKTLKNRPNLVTLKANLGENNQAVVVSFEDPASTDYRDGITIENLISDSNASNMAGVGSAAYAALKSAELDQWEGEVTLPGVVGQMMSEGDSDHAGSGVPVSITDSRYGIVDIRTRARQVEYNYNTCTTKVTLGNYDLTYSSGIANTNALAVEVSDMVGGISDTTLYNQQYAYIKTNESWTPKESGNTIAIIREESEDGQPPRVVARFIMDDPQIYQLPNGNCVAVGTLKADGEKHLPPSKAYGITGVELNGATTRTIQIPDPRRPDFLLGQTLTVCVLINTTGTP